MSKAAASQIAVLLLVWCCGAGLFADERAEKANWWSLRPIERPQIPRLSDTADTANPIDQFLLARLREIDLSYSPEADRRTLIRRLCFDLTGLPPTPAEVQAFLEDDHPQAYERLVVRLLDSPHYGERWARHWLDLVHYGDSHGYDKDQPRPNAWRYRDYVIRALNDDIPYAQFVSEQLAADVVATKGDAIPALGFISAGPWDLIGHAELPETKIDGKIARHLDRDDMVANTMSTFTSMTVHCAQCHNHKFDPISSEDYYSLQSVFAALDRTNLEYDDDLALTRKRNDLRARERLLDKERQRLEAVLKEGPTEDKSAEITRFFAATNLLTEVRAALGQLPAPKIAFVGAVHYGSGAFRGTGPDGGRPRPIHLLARGDVRKPGREITPGALEVIEELGARFDLPGDAPESARRVALARWITDRRNPLTWRSIVNRVWQYHFGRGLVDTPNDFGRMGSLPTHPELLDWLAAEFRDGSQSLKALHRLIVTSRAYRQSSTVKNERAAALDRDNRLLWRMNRRKLEAENIRDAILQVSGRLNPAMYGPAFQDFVIEKPEHSPHYQYHLHNPDDPRSDRRSIYRFIVRSQQQPFMTALDCADPSLAVEKRNESLSALQALALLNDGFIISLSRSFAERLSREASTPEAQATRAFELALARQPTDSELRDLAGFVREHGLPNTCRLIFNLNEFMFAD